MLTLDLMRQMWPHGNTKVPGLVEGIVAAGPTVFPKYGIASALELAHAMAQFSHECDAGLEMVENIHYTAARACKVWPSRFKSEADCYAKVGSFAGDPEFPIKLIDNVYGGRMGNRAGTHDGSTYIGRGLAQTTGFDAYAELANITGLDIVAHPELIIAPEHALECGVADFVKICGCLPFAQRDDIVDVTKHLNGGLIGLDMRKAWLAKWKVALGLAAAPPARAPTPHYASEPDPEPVSPREFMP